MFCGFFKRLLSRKTLRTNSILCSTFYHVGMVVSEVKHLIQKWLPFLSCYQPCCFLLPAISCWQGEWQWTQPVPIKRSGFGNSQQR